ncbi:MAG TPA: hypothetical protein ENJ95_00165 [Bacteroidetes bacterium]|nr:hypothetical protein [Bacteroidota bacterium]
MTPKFGSVAQPLGCPGQRPLGRRQCGVNASHRDSLKAVLPNANFRAKYISLLHVSQMNARLSIFQVKITAPTEHQRRPKNRKTPPFFEIFREYISLAEERKPEIEIRRD